MVLSQVRQLTSCEVKSQVGCGVWSDGNERVCEDPRKQWSIEIKGEGKMKGRKITGISSKRIGLGWHGLAALTHKQICWLFLVKDFPYFN